MHLAIHTVVKPLIVGGLLTLLPLTAQGPHHEGGPGPGHIFQQLNLTDTQKASLKTIADKHHANLDALRKTSEAAQQAFQKAMKDPATKDADLKALHTKVSDARFAEILEHRAMMQESKGILTPEQKTQLDKAMAEDPRHEGGPWHGGPRHKGGPEGPHDAPDAP
jgi:periplasmic protein CpxP/Spy